MKSRASARLLPKGAVAPQPQAESLLPIHISRKNSATPEGTIMDILVKKGVPADSNDLLVVLN